AVADALGKVGDANSASQLTQHTQDKDDWVRVSVVKSLGDIGNIVAENALIEALDDGNDWVRYHAAFALAAVKSHKSRDLLAQRMASDSSENVRKAISSALHILG